jgi:hypothetical protein
MAVTASTFGAAAPVAPAAFTPRQPLGDARAATAGGWHCRASESGRRPVTARDRGGAVAPFAYSRERPQTARAQISSTWSRHAGSARPVSAATGLLTRSDKLRRESQRKAEVGTVRDLDSWETSGGAQGAREPPRWRIKGGPWLEYSEGGPYPREPRGKRGKPTREMPLQSLLPQRGPTPEPPKPTPPPPAGDTELARERALRLAAEKERDAARHEAEQAQDKLKHNEAAIKTMLESIAEMEAAIDEDSLQDAKRERILQEEQERVRDITVRLHKTQSTLAMLQRKYGDEGNEQGDTKTALRSEVLRLRDAIKSEQAQAHCSREEMSRERKARIVAEARVAELQRYIDADAEADRKREQQLAKLKAEAELDALEDARRAREAEERERRLQVMEEERKKDAEEDAEREARLKQLEAHIEVRSERLVQSREQPLRLVSLGWQLSCPLILVPGVLITTSPPLQWGTCSYMHVHNFVFTGRCGGGCCA